MPVINKTLKIEDSNPLKTKLIKIREHERNGDYTSAAEILEEIAENERNDVDYSRAQSRRAGFLRARSAYSQEINYDFQGALREYISSISNFKRSGDVNMVEDLTRSAVINSDILAKKYIKWNNLFEAAKLLDTSGDMLSEIGSDKDSVKRWVSAGHIYRKSADINKRKGLFPIEATERSLAYKCFKKGNQLKEATIEAVKAVKIWEDEAEKEQSSGVFDISAQHRKMAATTLRELGDFKSAQEQDSIANNLINFKNLRI